MLILAASAIVSLIRKFGILQPLVMSGGLLNQSVFFSNYGFEYNSGPMINPLCVGKRFSILKEKNNEMVQ
jgi:hypothetical protein